MMKMPYDIQCDLLPWTFMSRQIHEASANGRTIEIEEMSREGADLNDTDEMGNTPLWLAYLAGHLDTVFALLELNVDINRRTGVILASDFHRACAWADEVFIDILCNYQANVNLTDRFGKTPLIYAIEYRTYSSSIDQLRLEEDLLEFLIDQGANVNHADQSGLTPLFYAIYRGIASIVQLLLHHQADYKFENILGYSPLRYALGCLSYAHPNDGWIYQGRLDIVRLLLDRYDRNEIELKQAILGHSPTMAHLFPLFDFIFYSRTQSRFDYERIAWNAYEQTRWPCSTVDGNLLLAQNFVVFHLNIEHFIYFLQRMFICNYEQLFIFYLQRVIKDKESTNRFLLLLYCSFVEMAGQRTYVEMLRNLVETQRIYFFKQRREMIRSMLNLCQRGPVRLAAFCRQLIRQKIRSSIDRCLIEHCSLPKSLHQFLLIDELRFFTVSPSSKEFFSLIDQSIRLNSSSIHGNAHLATKSPSEHCFFSKNS